MAGFSMKKQKSILDNLYLAAPCSVPWDAMVGDERQRDCSGCSRTVYNISEMSRRDAERFLLEKGTSECMRFYRRQDGTIMTDDCPRALRKLRDRCKMATKIAVSMVAFMVSLPSALAQAIQTRETRPIKIIRPSFVIDRKRSYDALNGGAICPPEFATSFDPNTPPPTSIPATTTSVEARVVTRQHTLPNGKIVKLVTADEKGRVVRVDSSKKFVPKHTSNSFIDTRSSDFFSKAQSAVNDRNFKLAEFYLEKSLEMCNQQRSSDPEFRRRLETELKNVRARNSDSREKAYDDFHETQQLVDPTKPQYIREW